MFLLLLVTRYRFSQIPEALLQCQSCMGAVKSCYKAAWELRAAFLKPQWEVGAYKNFLDSKLFVAPMQH